MNSENDSSTLVADALVVGNGQGSGSGDHQENVMYVECATTAELDSYLVNSENGLRAQNGDVEGSSTSNGEQSSDTVTCSPDDSTGNGGTSGGKNAAKSAKPMSYNSVFPSLKSKAAPVNATGAWGSGKVGGAKSGDLSGMKIASSKVRDTFKLANEERRHNREQNFGAAAQAKIINEIMKKTETTIEIHVLKNVGVNFLITGKPAKVAEAKKLLALELQVEGERSLYIPRDHYRHISGKGGEKRKDIEARTGTKVMVPFGDGETNDPILIKGPKESIDKAVALIKEISDQLLANSSDRISVEKVYHAFIAGPYNVKLNEIQKKTNTKIHMPPRSVEKDEIVINGEVNAVAAARKLIQERYDEIKSNCQTATVWVKPKVLKNLDGKYRKDVINDIFENAGVMVEFPTEVGKEEVTLRGPGEQLGQGVMMLMTEVNSQKEDVIAIEPWMKKYLVGTKGTRLRELIGDKTKVSVVFEDNGIEMHGPIWDVAEVEQRFFQAIAELKTQVTVALVPVDQRHHRFIVGKNGAQIKQIKQETGARIDIPNDGDEDCNVIKIEGTPEAVAKAEEQIHALIAKLEEKEKEIQKDLIIEQRFHRQLIGTKGDKINEVKKMFEGVQINFPTKGEHSDKVSVKGDKKAVEQCYAYLSNIAKELLDNNYRAELQVNKQVHKLIIGKNGAKINAIRAETDTKIDIPETDSASNVIIVTGKPANVEKAKKLIFEIEEEEMSLVNLDMIIPNKFHNLLKALMRSIQEKHNVNIKFPEAGSESDKVTIRGAKESVLAAKHDLFETYTNVKDNNYQETVSVNPQLRNVLIGKNGANIKKFKEKYNVRVLFPYEGNEGDATVIGKEDLVQKASEELRKYVASLENMDDDTIDIPKKHHSNFIRNTAALLKSIEEEFGVKCRFPPKDAAEGAKVQLRGPKDLLPAAKVRLQEIVREIEDTVTVEFDIDSKYHGSVLGAKGSNLAPIEEKYNVKIHFPRRKQPGARGPGENGWSEESAPAATPQPEEVRSNTIKVTGLASNCEKAKDELLALVPVTVAIEVPFENHKYLMRQKGQFLKSLREQFNVNISIPPMEEQSSTIGLSGLDSQVKKAKKALADKIRDIEKEKKQQEESNYRVELRIKPDLHPKIIGKGGANVKEMRKQHDVRIIFPDKKSDTEAEDADAGLIVVIGAKKGVEAAVKKINKIAREMESLVREVINFDSLVADRVEDLRGKDVKELSTKFGADIRINRNQIVISGNDANVKKATNHLNELLEEFTVECAEEERYIAPKVFSLSNELDLHTNGKMDGFYSRPTTTELKDSKPNTKDRAEFPLMKSENGHVDNKPKVFWGPKKA